jgi:hypothetical protein
VRLAGRDDEVLRARRTDAADGRYLRLIVNQPQIPDQASVSITEGTVTIEWSE